MSFAEFVANQRQAGIRPEPVYGVQPHKPQPVINADSDVLPIAPCLAPGGELIARSVEGRPFVENVKPRQPGVTYTVDMRGRFTRNAGGMFSVDNPSGQDIAAGPYYGPTPPRVDRYDPMVSGPGTGDRGAVGYCGGGMLSDGGGDPNDQGDILPSTGVFRAERHGTSLSNG
jgi:hypothetical protein